MIKHHDESGGAMAAPGEDICRRCNGTGFVTLIEDGVERAARCSCRRRPDQDRLSSLCLPPRFIDCAFEDSMDKTDQARGCKGFHELNNPSLTVAKRKAKTFVADFPSDRKGLLFMGRCGVGKTHLAVAILKALATSKGVRGRFCDFHELLREIKNSYNPVSGTSEKSLLQPVCSVDLLLLDDLGAEKPPPWVRDTLHFVINQRYLRQLPTLITTNFLDLESVQAAGNGQGPSRLGQHYGEETLADRIGYRLRSRLYEMCHVLLMDGSDFREGIGRI